MSEEYLKNVNKNENENENMSNKAPEITVNDPSFTVRVQPHEQKSKTETFVSGLKSKWTETSSTLLESMDFSMEALIKQALYSFENFIDPKLPESQRIPFEQLKDIKGIMFLTVVKGGLGVGGLVGTGIIMARNPNWKTEWASPCAIGLGGLQIGLNIGIEKTDHIIFIRDENVISKFHNGIRLGGDVSLSIGPLGRDANFGMTVNQKGAITNVSYSMSKGVYLGFALEGAVVTIRNDCNEKFFCQTCDVSSILNGSIKAPYNEDFVTLCKKLYHCMNPNSSIMLNENVKDEHHPILNISSNPKTD